ncbi:prevent-host-death protein [Acrocarpospora catenulata]|uniref:prevent-host-death protein n=1 Tax=Acrocarpospora catenulata TaxID=2836182 RepID=UPI001BD94B2E|nr:prevent-host-death protein [Acrocarpospora catenulata]
MTVSEPARSHQISEQDLHARSAEIMNGLERGESYAATRNSSKIGDLNPIRHRRRFVSRADFAAMSQSMPILDDRKYREDMDRHVNDDLFDPYDRAYGRDEFTEAAEGPPRQVWSTPPS